MKKARSKELTAAQKAQIEALAAMSEDQIDTQDIPEQLNWSDAKRGLFYRPIKQQITLRLDADVVDWFKTHAAGPDGEGYQTELNRALREHMIQRQRAERAGKSLARA